MLKPLPCTRLGIENDSPRPGFFPSGLLWSRRETVERVEAQDFPVDSVRRGQAGPLSRAPCVRSQTDPVHHPPPRPDFPDLLRRRGPVCTRVDPQGLDPDFANRVTTLRGRGNLHWTGTGGQEGGRTGGLASPPLVQEVTHVVLGRVTKAPETGDGRRGQGRGDVPARVQSRDPAPQAPTTGVSGTGLEK